MFSLESFLRDLAPEGRRFANLTPFEEDEDKWFQLAVIKGVFRFGECIVSCPRLKRWKRTGHDEFLTPNGQARHLFNFQIDPSSCLLSREYIPHIAVVSRLLTEKMYDRERYSFSLYRSFSRDLIDKKQGSPFETDAEFYDSHGDIYLHLEAKKSRRETEAIANQIESVSELGAMPQKHRKELEYVLDLKPRYLWLVGPSLIDPEQFVYEVYVEGRNATFRRIENLPAAPK